MLKKVLLVAAILVASPALTSAQDIFWSFSETESSGATSLAPGDTGSASIFSDGLLGFDGIDLNLAISDPNVVRLTGGEAFNPMFNLIGGQRFDTADLDTSANGSSARLFALSLTQNGVDPDFATMFDPGFNFTIGPNGAVLLARVDFEIVGEGSTDFSFSLGPQGVFQFPATPVFPLFESATLTSVGIPEITFGDVNLDGSVDMLDVFPFICHLMNRTYQIEADFDEDGDVNFFDINPFRDVLLGL